MTDPNSYLSTSSMDDEPREQECSPPPHPFFESATKQASFAECIDALDSVNAMVELCGFLKLETGEELGLTPKAAFGYNRVLLLMGGTLSYVSKRLYLLNSLQRDEHARLSATLKSVQSLDAAKKAPGALNLGKTGAR